MTTSACSQLQTMANKWCRIVFKYLFPYPSASSQKMPIDFIGTPENHCRPQDDEFVVGLKFENNTTATTTAKPPSEGVIKN